MPEPLQPHEPERTVDHIPLAGVPRPETVDCTGAGQSTDATTPYVPTAPVDAPHIPGYAIRAEIARGGMGRVYAAFDLSLDREVAIKTLLPGANAERFITESRITARLPHPGIPPVHALGTLDDGSPYLAMKRIHGQTLEELLRQRGSPQDELPRFVQIFEQVAQAVGFAHARNIIHRDLKPLNIMVGEFGEVQVMDWGLAKDLASRGQESPEAIESTQTEHTQAGAVIGTPSYMAPEQARGEPVDARADVFALGSILAAMLTGQPAFVGTTPHETLAQAAGAQLADVHARLDETNADAELVELARRSLAERADERPANAREVAAEVAAYRAGVEDRLHQAMRDRTRAATQAAEQRKWRRIAWRAGAAFTALLLVGIAGTTWSLREARTQAAIARLRGRIAEHETSAKNDALKAEADERKRADLAHAKEAEANAVVKFLQDHVFAAARPKGQDGGLGADVSLRDAIAASAPALDKNFARQPLVEARLRIALGTTFQDLSEYDLARIQFERVWDLYDPKVGPNHQDTLKSMNNLATCYQALNRPTEALELREQVLAIQKRVLRPQDLDTLKNMNNLANSYEALNRPAEALKVRAEFLAFQKGALPPDDPQTATDMMYMANSYEALNRPTEALELREEGVAFYKRLLPKDHPDTRESMHRLAVSYANLNRHAEAIKLFEEVLAIRKRMLYKDHPVTVQRMHELALSYMALNRYDEALKLNEEVLAIWKRVLGKDHPNTLASQTNLAVSYRELKREEEAKPLLEDSFRRKLQVLPADHQHLYVAAFQLAECYRALGQGEKVPDVADQYVWNMVEKKQVYPQGASDLLAKRNQYFQMSGDPADCRTSAEMWEKLNLPDAESLYTAAGYRAVTAAVQAKAKGADSARLAQEDADQAMVWLTKAVAAGYKDAAQMKQDTDLDALREREDFQKLLAELEKKAAGESKQP